MAILLPNETGSLDDVNEQVYIGLKMPLQTSGPNGYFESTSTTIQAVRENISSLLKTRVGERIFNPTLGTTLNRRLFEPITATTSDEIRGEISNLIQRWLPFVSISDISVNLEAADATDQKNTILDVN